MGKLKCPFVCQFELPGLPKMANTWGRTNGFKRNRENKVWYHLVLTLCRYQLPLKPLKKAELTLTRYSSSEPDFDGLVLSFKPIVDGLVQAGVLANDKLSNTGVWIVKWEKCPPKKGRIEVVVRSRE